MGQRAASPCPFPLHKAHTDIASDVDTGQVLDIFMFLVDDLGEGATVDL